MVRELFFVYIFIYFFGFSSCSTYLYFFLLLQELVLDKALACAKKVFTAREQRLRSKKPIAISCAVQPMMPEWNAAGTVIVIVGCVALEFDIDAKLANGFL